MIPNKSSRGHKLSTDSFPSNGFGGLTFYESINIHGVSIINAFFDGW